MNYIGIQNIIKAMKVNKVSKLIRITGAAVGKSPFNPFKFLFAVLLSMSTKWFEMSENYIRENCSGDINYTVLRPTGLSTLPSASQTADRRLILQQVFS